MRKLWQVLAVYAFGAVIGLTGCSVNGSASGVTAVSEEPGEGKDSGSEAGDHRGISHQTAAGDAAANKGSSQTADAAAIEGPPAEGNCPELEDMKLKEGIRQDGADKDGLIAGERYTAPTQPEKVQAGAKSKSYYMVTEEDSVFLPCLTLFDDQTFGFTYDPLSSSYPNGTYRIEGGRLTAVTKDETHTYVFQADNDKYIFLEDESSDAALIDRRIGSPVTDRAVFALREPEEEMVQMRAVVKEIKEDRFLVSSRSDENPGAFYVYFGENDVGGIKPGDEVEILWDGSVLETDPAQIYARTIQWIQ